MIVPTKKINDFIENTQTHCSYKYIVLYLLIHKKFHDTEITESQLAIDFNSFYLLRGKLGLLREYEPHCKPSESYNSKKTLKTPLNIFLKENLIIYEKRNNEKIIKIQFSFDESTIKLLEDNIISYFQEYLFDDPKDIRELLKIWNMQFKDNFTQSKKQQFYDKYYLKLYNKTFILKKPSKDFSASMKIEYVDNSGPIFIVQRNSQIDVVSNPNSDFNYEEDAATANLHALREKLLEENIIIEENKKLILKENQFFLSPSTASQFVSGTTSNGKTDWKLDNGLRLKDILQMRDLMNPEFSLLSKKSEFPGYGALMAFFIDKWYNMSIDSTPSQNPINVNYFLKFFDSFGLPVYKDYKGKDNPRKFRFFNIFTNNFASTDTLADFRKPRNFGCIHGLNNRRDCDNRNCEYFKDRTHSCDRSKELIWTVSSQSEKDYTFASDYLISIQNDLLKGQKLDFSLIYSILYYNTEPNEEISSPKSQFIKDFHFSDKEFLIIFDNSEKIEPDLNSSEDTSILNSGIGNSEKKKYPSKQNSIENDFPLSKEDICFKNTTSSFKFTEKYLNLDNAIYDVVQIEDFEDLLKNNKQIILYGPPGTGKTYLAQILAEKISHSHYEIVQFHPSYSYEDFIEGIDAVPSRNNDSVIYKPNSRIFRNLCQYAQTYSNKNVVLIIDEINRGDLSRIFGECILGLEPSYRGKLNISTPLSRYLKPLRIPENLFIIGTMNSLDRSISIVDYALRRRFLFIKISPNHSVLKKWQEKHPIENNEQNRNLHRLLSTKMLKDDMTFYKVINGLFERLNQMINKDRFLSENHKIGHTYFFVKSFREFNVNWNYKIIPMLEEFLNFNTKQLKNYSLSKILEALYDNSTQN